MFAQHSVILAHDIAAVEAVFGRPDHPWTIGLDGSGETLLASVGLRLAGVPLYKEVRLTLGPPGVQIRQGRTILPVSWTATGGSALFPRMEGSLDIDVAPPDGTRLTLNASYDPPLGKLGDLLDRAALRRLADATIRDFLERVAVRLESELSQPGAHPAA